MKKETVDLTLAASQFGKEKNYWLKKLSGLETKNRFFYDFQAVPGKSRNYDTVEFQFTGRNFTRLTELSKGVDHTLHIILSAVLVALLGKYTGSKDIIIGTPIYKQDIEGEFINTVLALRSFIEDNMTFKEILLQVKQTIVEAAENQNYPVERLIHQLNMSSSDHDFPLFDIALLLESIHDKAYLKPVNLNVIFSFSKTGEYLNGTIEYNAALYKRTTIERIVSHYMNLMGEVLFNVDLCLSKANILSFDEKQQLLVDFNGIKEQYPGAETIHEIFKEQVEKTPHGIAVKYKHTQLSYSQLNRTADHLAHVLRKKGVNRDKVVGLMVDRSPGMIAGILGILKAGGAYLPIDTEYPRERIKYMLEDSGVKLLLTNDEIEPGQPGNGQSPYIPEVVEIINIRGKNKYPGESRAPGCVNKSTDLLYVIYTSGSTGKPKGVMLEHRNLINLLAYQFKHTGIDFSDVLQFTTISFDVSFQEIFSALLSGGTLHLIDKDTRNDIAALFEVVEKNRIKTLFLPASFLKFIFNEEQYAALIPPVVKHIVTAGEQVIVNHRFRRYLIETDTTLHNHYGPAETHVVTALTLDPAGEIPGIPPIGIPVSNTGIYILDREKHLLPAGVPGELYIGGVQVGRGYVNNPGLTNDKFLNTENNSDSLIPYPLYRSGDLARWLPDGNIEFLGRMDHQVKIRGFRVEPGEIENHLLNYEGIKDLVVLTKEDESGQNYLCAYFVSESELSVSELRNYLSNDLPDYMIPSAFMRVNEIPLNKSGKVDRKALPEPEIQENEKIILPGNEIEKKLAELWSEVLGIEKGSISIDANFFDIGGHSLKATILITKIHKKLNVKVSLAELFASPTIDLLAKCIKKIGYVKHTSIEPAEKKEYYPLSSAQKRIYLVQHMEINSTTYNMPAVLILVGAVDRKRLEDSFTKLVKRHENFRTSFEIVNDEPVQRIYDEVPFEIVYQHLDTGKEKGEVKKIVNAFESPFDLSQVPLLRVELVDIGEDKHILMIDMHHIISDGTSIEILKGDLSEFMAGKELESLPLQYKDFSNWQNNLLKSGQVKQQEDYWLNLYSGEIPKLNLPLDHPRPQVFNFKGDYYEFNLIGEEMLELNEFCKRNDVTLYMNLLAVFNVLLFKYSEQTDIIVGSGIAGRPHADLQNVMGMFVNMLAMRNFPEGGKTYKAFLNDVKKHSIEAFENQDVQFEELVDKLNLERDTSRNPLFDASIFIQNFTKIEEGASRIEYLKKLEELQLADQVLLLEEDESMVSRFDLLFLVYESRDEICVYIEYYTAIFKKETIERMVIHFKNIIQTVIKDSSIKLKDIEIISEEEKKKILNEFNDTKSGYLVDKTIHGLFEAQEEKTPDKTALMYKNIILSYRELNRRANLLAYILRKKGIDRNRVVGLMIERSPEMIIGILAVMKAGGAFLPIDPDYPEDSVITMLNDSQVSILFTDSKNENKALLKESNHEIVIVDWRMKKSHRGSEGNLENINHPDDLVYVIYTSGSTGKPKGVMLEHRNLVNLLIYQFQYTNIDFSRVLQFTNISFDVSIQEIFSTLLSGGTLYLINKDARNEIVELFKVIEKNQISTLFLPASFLKFIFSEEHYAMLIPGLVDHIVTAGEQVIVRDRFRKYLKENNAYLHNHYGPSETHVVTALSLDPGEEIPELPSIGKPISNTYIYIVDKEEHLQPIGVPGELYIGGNQVGRGYISQRELTIEKFTMYQPVQGAVPLRIYRTGDLAKWLPDGNIEFLGRVDSQVKIRGFRVEPEGIETRLLNIESIKEAAVLAKEDKSGQNYLCAYFVSDYELSSPELRDYLSRDLPAYMIPSFFMRVKEIPLTRSGKVDRKAFPEPEIQEGEKIISPRDEIETGLAELWSEVLDLDKNVIGIDSNFFNSGGHSLRATIMASKIHKVFNVKLPLIEIFKSPTIRGLAEYIKRMGKEKFAVEDDSLVLLREKESMEHHFFFIHDGTGEVEGYIEFCQRLTNGFNCWGIRADRLENLVPQNWTIEQLARKYIEKIKKVQPQGPYYLAGWSGGGIISFEIVKQLEQENEEIAFLGLIDAPAPQTGNWEAGEFNLESELNIIKDFLPNDQLNEKLKNVTELRQIWPIVIEFLETDNPHVETLKKTIARYGMEALPKYRQLETRETIHYLNIGRTVHNMLALYSPQGKIHTPIHFFAAAQSEWGTAEPWHDYCYRVIDAYEIPCDHYAVFKMPQVDEFANRFDGVLSSLLSPS